MSLADSVNASKASSKRFSWRRMLPRANCAQGLLGSSWSRARTLLSASSYCLACTREATVAAGLEQLHAALPGLLAEAAWREVLILTFSGQMAATRQAGWYRCVSDSMRSSERPAAFHQRMASDGRGGTSAKQRPASARTIQPGTKRFTEPPPFSPTMACGKNSLAQGMHDRSPK